MVEKEESPHSGPLLNYNAASAPTFSSFYASKSSKTPVSLSSSAFSYSFLTSFKNHDLGYVDMMKVMMIIADRVFKIIKNTWQ